MPAERPPVAPAGRRFALVSALTPDGLGLTPQAAPLVLTFTPVTVTTR